MSTGRNVFLDQLNLGFGQPIEFVDCFINLLIQLLEKRREFIGVGVSPP